ncbi:MAG: DUF134 domain-containing protein [Candidatus Omnitrophica bacterium]|nr:DUF134 domain-containing protein [Candidatus Omnitrophota bacterium]
MRPKKTRWIKCLPGERCFRPQGRLKEKAEGIFLTVDEFEAIRLADLEGLTHAKSAKLMKISRPTFTRILASAHGNVADGLVNIKAIRIEGGCCRIKKEGKKDAGIKR